MQHMLRPMLLRRRHGNQENRWPAALRGRTCLRMLRQDMPAHAEAGTCCACRRSVP